MIKVYQFHLTEGERMRVSALGWDCPHPRIQAYLKKSFGDVGDVNMEYYTHVANVLTDDRETAFCLMNLWEQEELIEKLQDQVYSMSVGDIVEMENGTRYLCATFGFKEI